MNFRGQYFDVFKLLIAVIMALALLLIILNSVNYFTSLSISISETRIIDGLKNAVKAPDVVNKENPLIIKEASLGSKTWHANELARLIGLNKDCFSFDARIGNGSAFKLENESDGLFRRLVVSKDLVSNIFIYCLLNNSRTASVCPITCKIGFGKVPA